MSEETVGMVQPVQAHQLDENYGVEGLDYYSSDEDSF